MKKEAGKGHFRESMKLFAYGFITAHKLIPAYFPCMLVRACMTAAQPLLVLFFSARILNELSGGQNISRIIVYAALTVGLTFLLSVARAVLVREIESRAGAEQALRRLHMMEAERFATMDFAHTENSAVSEMLAQMDLQARSTARGLFYLYIVPAEAAESLFSLVFAALLLTGAFRAGGAGLHSSWTGIMLLVLLIFGVLLGLRHQARAKTVLQDIVAKATGTNAMANYYFEYVKAEHAAKDLRIYNQNETLRAIFRAGLDSKPWISFMNLEGRNSAFQMGLLAAIAGGFYLLVGSGALGGGVPAGSVVQTVGAVSAIAAAVGVLITRIGAIYSNAPFIKPIYDYLSLPDSIHEGTTEVPLRDGHAFEIEFRNVSFRYPGADSYALQNLNLKLNPGERLAIVGPNGSGKTTMVKLLCRLYAPTEGEILLDGLNIREYDYEQYMALFSVVFQDFMLFPLWLGQNVAAGETYDAALAEKRLGEAGFAGRLGDMPDGLDTILYKEFDEDGTQVSGGEAQKIALARALYKNAPVVVLDEPTAALDPIAEYEVYTAFDNIIGGKTAVFISHRLSSCRFCGRVAVFDRGRLVQLGAHEELLADSSGRYYDLWEAQAGHYRESEESARSFGQ